MNIYTIFFIAIFIYFSLEILCCFFLFFPFELHYTSSNKFFLSKRKKIHYFLLRFIKPDILNTLEVKRKEPFFRKFLYFASKNLAEVSFLFILASLPFLFFQIKYVDPIVSSMEDTPWYKFEHIIIELKKFLNYFTLNPFALMIIYLIIAILGGVLPFLEIYKINSKLVLFQKNFKRVILVVAFMNSFTFFSTKESDKINGTLVKIQHCKVSIQKEHDEIYADIDKQMNEIITEEVLANDIVIKGFEKENNVIDSLDNIKFLQENLAKLQPTSRVSSDSNGNIILNDYQNDSYFPHQSPDAFFPIPLANIFINNAYNTISSLLYIKVGNGYSKYSLNALRSTRSSILKTFELESAEFSKVVSLSSRYKTFVESVLSNTYKLSIKVGLNRIMPEVISQNKIASTIFESVVDKPAEKIITEYVNDKINYKVGEKISVEQINSFREDVRSQMTYYIYISPSFNDLRQAAESYNNELDNDLAQAKLKYKNNLNSYLKAKLQGTPYENADLTEKSGYLCECTCSGVLLWSLYVPSIEVCEALCPEGSPCGSY